MGVINKRNLNTLLLTERSPVREKLERLGDDVVFQARENAAEKLETRFGPDAVDQIVQAINFEVIRRGFLWELRIGIEDTGKATRWLSTKEDREHNWLQPALEQVTE